MTSALVPLLKEEFKLDDIEKLIDDNEACWFKRAHVGKFLDIAHVDTSTTKLTDEDKKSRVFYNLIQPKEVLFHRYRQTHGKVIQIDKITQIYSCLWMLLNTSLRIPESQKQLS